MMKIQHTAAACLLVGLLSIGVQADEKPSQDSAQVENANQQPAQMKQEEQVVDLRKIPYLPDESAVLFIADPGEIKAVREAQLQEQTAKYQPLRKVQSLSDLEVISGTGDKMPVVYVTPEYPTSVLFTDMTGQPWPIKYAGATETLVDAIQPPGTTNALVLYAKNVAGEKSMTLFLEGLLTPVTIIVKGDDSRYHAVKNIRISESGPNASIERLYAKSDTIVSKEHLEASSKTTDVLNKLAYTVTPDGFIKLKSDREGVDAWVEKDKPGQVYLRTKYAVMSPGPVGGGAGVTPLQGDVRLYVLPRINPIVALNQHGERLYITLREK